MTIIHKTPGLIPLEAFTVMGLSAKPNSSNPIGRFGTGLKYSIAVLLRMNLSVTLFIGRTEYVFYRVDRKFRSQDYQGIRMKKRKGLASKWTYHDLPFTTSYGRDWELWQVCRELHSNTLDEKGVSYRLAEDAVVRGEEDYTLFVIEGAAYDDVFFSRDTIFLPDGLTVRTTSETIQVLNKPSKHIYYRGMRVMDLRQDAQFTYNFLESIDLTEDRTIKYPSIIEARIVGFMQESEDSSFLSKAVRSPAKNSYEATISHHTGYSTGLSYARLGKAYMAAAKDSSNPTAKKIWDEQQPTVRANRRLTLIVPRDVQDFEVAQLVEAVTGIWPTAKLFDEAGLSLLREDEDSGKSLPF